MKKMIAFLLAAMFALSLCACSDSGEKKESKSDSSAAELKAESSSAGTKTESASENTKTDEVDSGLFGTWKTDSIEWKKDNQGLTKYDITMVLNEDRTFSVREVYSGTVDGVDHSVDEETSGEYSVIGSAIYMTVTHMKMTADGQTSEQDASEGEEGNLTAQWYGDTIVIESTNNFPIQSVTLKKKQ